MDNIILGVTGSVATMKTAKLAEHLVAASADLTIVATDAAMYFLSQVGITKSNLNTFSPALLTDDDEWPQEFKLGDEVLHIELRKRADALVIAPLDANTLAKIANGICDNLLTCLVRAWDWSKPMILCPAMNTAMWENDPTAKQLLEMSHRGAVIVYPVSKKLACGDIGMGALANHEDIVEAVLAAIKESRRWSFPLMKCSGIPINHHPGAFGFNRRKNHHTGVDLYCDDGVSVYAVEDGTIVKIDVFTGPKAGHTWWEETYGIMVEGKSGVVNYGEVQCPKELVVGDKVKKGQQFARIKRVLFPDRLRPDIPGHSCSMLHLELYKHGTREFADWHDPQKNPNLCDPTPLLMAAIHAPSQHLTWDNSEAKTVG